MSEENNDFKGQRKESEINRNPHSHFRCACKNEGLKRKRKQKPLKKKSLKAKEKEEKIREYEVISPIFQIVYFRILLFAKNTEARTPRIAKVLSNPGVLLFTFSVCSSPMTVSVSSTSAGVIISVPSLSPVIA